MGVNMAKKGNQLLSIDTSDVEDLMNGLKQALTQAQYRQLMFRVMTRAATRTKVLIKKAVQNEYHAKGGWVSQAIAAPRISTGSEVSCIIPVDGTRGKIGRGMTFTASASGNSGKGVRSNYAGRAGKRTRRSYKITAQVVKAGASELPVDKDSNRPHFMVMGRAGAVGRVFVVRRDLGKYFAKEHRRTKKKGVRSYTVKKTMITSAVGIGVPQMPMTRSANEIQAGVVEIMKARIEHEHIALLKKYVASHMK